jgi:hypothetical protein
MGRSWTDSRGNSYKVKLFASRATGYYDGKFQNTNWERFDTVEDAADFGIWINLSQLRVIIFKKGEEILMVCKNWESFRAELTELRQLYKNSY